MTNNIYIYIYIHMHIYIYMYIPVAYWLLPIWLFPAAYWLLPIGSCLLPIPYSPLPPLLPIPYFLFPTAVLVLSFHKLIA